MYKSVIFLAIIFSLFRLTLLFYYNPVLEMNIDEERSYSIAENSVAGRGYLFFDPELNKEVITAFHHSAPLFTYQFLIKNGIPKTDWVIFINILTAVVLGFSIVYFNKLANFFLNEKYSLAATILYCLFPTFIYYIGSLFYYENIVVSLLVISCYILVKSLRQEISLFEAAIFVISLLISISYRSQSIPIFGLILLTYAIIVIREKKWNYLSLVFAAVVFGTAVNIPGLIKNHELFGSYILSTQMGFEILQGNNPTARGVWNHDWRKPDDPLYLYARENIPDLDNLDEYQESVARKSLAVKFIEENPLSEIKLLLKKLAIYFAPFNYETKVVYNPFNFVVYFSFVIMLFIRFVRFNFNKDDLIIIAPVAASIFLTLVFYMGPRWRYYAEPFMMIYTMMFVKLIIDFFRKRTNAVL